MKQRIALLGSTGSIGIQTLDIVRENPGLFEITTLTAHRNWERLARQAVEFDADSVVIADERQYDALRQALDGTSIKVYAGEEALRQVVQSGQVDVVVNALVGYVGLMPTIAAVEAGKKVALANKETLVAGGCYVMPLAARHKAPIVPIDSGTLGDLPVPGGRKVARATADRHLQRRSFPRPQPRGAGSRNGGTGTEASPMADGRQDHDRQRHAGQ